LPLGAVRITSAFTVKVALKVLSLMGPEGWRTVTVPVEAASGS